MKKDHPLLGLLIIVLVFVGAVSIVYFRYLDNNLSNKKVTVYSDGVAEKKALEKNMKVYTNGEYGFELSYPSSAFTELGYIKSEDASRSDYLRIQNYKMDNFGVGLAKEEYYFEMYIINADEPCRSSVVSDGTAVNLGAATGYKGGLPGAEVIKEVSSAMCVYKDNKQFYAIVTEGDKEASIANSIFNSIKFVN